MNTNKKVLIVGLGLIGGSYATRLTELGYEVGAIDLNPQSIEYALNKGIIAHGNSQVEKDYIAQFDLIVFALYPKTFIKWIEQYSRYFKNGAILTDVTGVKSTVVYKVQELLPKGVEFIGAHPMAGTENSGVSNSTSKIFNGANFIITPTERNQKETVEFCSQLAKEMGFGKISVISPKVHDEIIGFLSQLAHCIAISLMCCKQSEELSYYSGDSFRDLTRIAKINDKMWSELFLLNKTALVEQIDKFTKTLNQLREYIELGDEEGMREMMRTSTQNRIKFDKKD